MKVVAAGHHYELLNLAKSRVAGELKFIHKEVRNGTLKLIADGTTTEEVLTVLIDRMAHLDKLLPSKENKTVSTHLNKALVALEARTAERQARGVEGTHKA